MDDRPYVNYGITNFDNLGRAMLTVFQIVTSDTWYYQMDNLMDVDIPFLGGAFCLILMILGQFFLINLILAVIIFAFIKSQKESLQDEVKAFHREEQVKEQKKLIEGNIKDGLVSIIKCGNNQQMESMKDSAPNREIAQIIHKEIIINDSNKNMQGANFLEND